MDLGRACGLAAHSPDDPAGIETRDDLAAGPGSHGAWLAGLTSVRVEERHARLTEAVDIPHLGCDQRRSLTIVTATIGVRAARVSQRTPSA